eukprot:TRINITY_DN2468_c0_g1_i1.p1 TRINITY_DN2468_c0_g1~~TRINITY_DN2468_c0_g1_i1.p1  ORF type:complete len:740 (+),score=139.38 TRINITY_DN2468_c0_g1_i1:57-2222(+)
MAASLTAQPDGLQQAMDAIEKCNISASARERLLRHAVYVHMHRGMEQPMRGSDAPNALEEAYALLSKAAGTCIRRPKAAVAFMRLAGLQEHVHSFGKLTSKRRAVCHPGALQVADLATALGALEPSALCGAAATFRDAGKGDEHASTGVLSSEGNGAVVQPSGTGVGRNSTDDLFYKELRQEVLRELAEDQCSQHSPTSRSDSEGESSVACTKGAHSADASVQTDVHQPLLPLAVHLGAEQLALFAAQIVGGVKDLLAANCQTPGPAVNASEHEAKWVEGLHKHLQAFTIQIGEFASRENLSRLPLTIETLLDTVGCLSKDFQAILSRIDLLARDFDARLEGLAVVVGTTTTNSIDATGIDSSSQTESLIGFDACTQVSTPVAELSDAASQTVHLQSSPRPAGAASTQASQVSTVATAEQQSVPRTIRPRWEDLDDIDAENEDEANADDNAHADHVSSAAQANGAGDDSCDIDEAGLGHPVGNAEVAQDPRRREVKPKNSRGRQNEPRGEKFLEEEAKTGVDADDDQVSFAAKAREAGDGSCDPDEAGFGHPEGHTEGAQDPRRREVKPKNSRGRQHLLRGEKFLEKETKTGVDADDDQVTFADKARVAGDGSCDPDEAGFGHPEGHTEGAQDPRRREVKPKNSRDEVVASFNDGGSRTFVPMENLILRGFVQSYFVGDNTGLEKFLADAAENEELAIKRFCKSNNLKPNQLLNAIKQSRR